MHILVIHEDEAFAKGLRYSLQREGHRITVAPDKASVSPLLRRYQPDLIILDKDSLEIDGQRPFAGSGEDVDMPLILLVARPEEEGVPEEEEDWPPERSRAFDKGHLRRAEAILERLRRLVEEDTSILEIGRLHIDFGRKRVTFHDRPLQLTPIQFRLLGSLALSTGRVMGYQELLEDVWGYQGDAGEARELLKVHINRTRHKMKALAEGGERYILSVRGFGYMLSPPDT
jgi:DNA-binding response OmpR family regulator